MASIMETPEKVGGPELPARGSDPAYQAYKLLHIGFVVAPLIAGVDKFFGFLVDWDKYLAPTVASLSPIGGSRLMSAAGVVEILAALIVALMPRFGGYIVALWMWAIIVNLLLIPGYFDVALRDFALSLGALALARLGARYDRG